MQLTVPTVPQQDPHKTVLRQRCFKNRLRPKNVLLPHRVIQDGLNMSYRRLVHPLWLHQRCSDPLDAIGIKSAPQRRRVRSSCRRANNRQKVASLHPQRPISQPANQIVILDLPQAENLASHRNASKQCRHALIDNRSRLRKKSRAIPIRITFRAISNLP